MTTTTARTPRLGSLFSGYGGLDMAVDLHAPVELAWVSEVDTAAWQAPGGGTGSAAARHNRAPLGLPPSPAGAAGVELLPTPTTQIQARPSPGYGDTSVAEQIISQAAASWGQYLPAITGHARAVGRPAPKASAPLKPGGRPRLRPEFVEWMMMLPEGHVTNPELDLYRAAMFRMLGNGVVPAQAAHALRVLAPIASQQLTQRVWGGAA